MKTANSHLQAHLQFAQAVTQTKNCKRACKFPTQEKLFLKISFPSKNFKNANTQPDTKCNTTMTAKLNTDNGCKTRWTRTPATNSTLPKVAVQCFVGQFCGYINFSASYEVCAVNRHLRQAANR